MKDTPSLHPFEKEILPMLVRAAQERSLATEPGRVRSPSRWIRVASVAAVAACLAIAAPVLSDDPLRGALAIEQRGDVIYVSVEDASADPEAMTNDLRAKGLPARVEAVPVSPSLEGVWVDIVNDNLDAGYNDHRISDVFEQITTRPEVLELPADFSTPFTLVVGRPAEADERYQIALVRDVESVGECLGVTGMTLAEATAYLEDKGFEVSADGPRDQMVVRAELLGPTSVIIGTDRPDQDTARSGHAC